MPPVLSQEIQYALGGTMAYGCAAPTASNPVVGCCMLGSNAINVLSSFPVSNNCARNKLTCQFAPKDQRLRAPPRGRNVPTALHPRRLSPHGTRSTNEPSPPNLVIDPHLVVDDIPRTVSASPAGTGNDVAPSNFPAKAFLAKENVDNELQVIQYNCAPLREDPTRIDAEFPPSGYQMVHTMPQDAQMPQAPITEMAPLQVHQGPINNDPRLTLERGLYTPSQGQDAPGSDSNKDTTSLVLALLFDQTQSLLDRVNDMGPQKFHIDDFGSTMLSDTIGRAQSIESLYRTDTLPKSRKVFEKQPCGVCSTSLEGWTDSRQVINKHSLRRNRSFHCDFIGCTNTTGFISQNDLDRHKRSVHADRSLQGSVYVCRVGKCPRDKIWPRLDNFRSHLCKIHNMTPAEVKQYIYNQSSSQEDVESDAAANQSANIPQPVGHQPFLGNQDITTDSGIAPQPRHSPTVELFIEWPVAPEMKPSGIAHGPPDESFNPDLTSEPQAWVRAGTPQSYEPMQPRAQFEDARD
ncbi:hypothetical protein EDB80DRAFT_899750 [Ilyonectria destructans]|nr:hypothetical protein EDB80DRAFT_899750 [Ilyonectria destructans]